MRAVVWLLLLFTIAAVARPPADARTRVLGDVVGCRGVLDTKVKATPDAGVAVIYDQCAKRVRILTADGRLTVASGGPGNILFDEFIWAAATRELYWIGPAARFDPVQRQFVRLAGPNNGARVATYIPRWGTIVIGATNGLFIAKGGGVEVLPSTGAPLGDVVRVTDLPRFGALLLELIDQSVLIRSADGKVHAIGRYGRSETTQDVAELHRSPAVQILSSREAFHVTMVHGPDGVWRPGPVRHADLDRTGAWVNGYVPALDAMFVRVLGWRLLDWWYDRSGFYTLGPNGLRPYGHYADRPPDRGAINVTTLPSTGETTMVLMRGGGDLSPRYRVTPAGFVPAPLPNEIGSFANAREVPGTGQVVVTTPTALWRLERRGKPTLLTRGEWVSPWPLPLTREVAFWETGGLGIIAPDGRRRHVALDGEKGRVIQLAPNRLFIIGDRITEVRLSSEHL